MLLLRRFVCRKQRNEARENRDGGEEADLLGPFHDHAGHSYVRDSSDAHLQRYHVVPLRLHGHICGHVWHDGGGHIGVSIASPFYAAAAYASAWL